MAKVHRPEIRQEQARWSAATTRPQRRYAAHKASTTLKEKGVKRTSRENRVF